MKHRVIVNATIPSGQSYVDVTFPFSCNILAIQQSVTGGATRLHIGHALLSGTPSGISASPEAADYFYCKVQGANTTHIFTQHPIPVLGGKKIRLMLTDGSQMSVNASADVNFAILVELTGLPE